MKLLNLLTPFIVIGLLFAGGWYFYQQSQLGSGDSYLTQYLPVPEQSYVGNDIQVEIKIRPGRANFLEKDRLNAFIRMSDKYEFEHDILAILTSEPGEHWRLVTEKTETTEEDKFLATPITCVDGQVTIRVIVQDKQTGKQSQLLIKKNC